MLRIACLFLLTLPALSQTAPVPDERAFYGVINRSSGRCLDVARAATASGAPLVQWEFTHAPNQQWRLVPIQAGGEYYRLEARHSGLCLTLETSPTAVPDAPTPLVQRPFAGGLGQQWRLTPAGPIGTFQLECRLDGRVATLAAADKFNNTAVVATRPAGRASQQWRLFELHLRLATGLPFGPAAALPALASTGGHELQPVPTADGRTLYFGRTRFAGNVEGVAESGDIWVSQRVVAAADAAAAQAASKLTTLPTTSSKAWPAPTPLADPPGLNTPQHNAVQAVVGTAERPALLLRGTYDGAGFHDEGLSRVALSTGGGKSGGSGGGRPVTLRVANYYSTSPATGFFMTPDEKILLLSLERTDAQGANDLYLIRPDGAGGYTAPQSLGAVVNSPGYDFAPWLSADTKALYFSSYGHMGYGSSDLFLTQRLDDTWEHWTPPQNLGPRFNGPGYDAFLALTTDGRTAYFSSSGRSDAAPKKLFQTAPAAPALTADPARPDTAAARRAALVAAATATDPARQPRALLTGRVLDGRTNQPLAGGADVVARLLSTTVNFRSTARADAVGFQMSLLPGRYVVLTSAGLLSRTDTLAVGAGESRRYEPRLTPAAVGARLDLPAVLFAQGQDRLLPSSFQTLNRLAASLKDNPALEIRLEGHTSNEPPAAGNQTLSEQRVAAVKRYLVGRGIAETRVSTIGYGGIRPRFSNDREETRRLNRRVELVITK